MTDAKSESEVLQMLEDHEKSDHDFVREFVEYLEGDLPATELGSYNWLAAMDAGLVLELPCESPNRRQFLTAEKESGTIYIENHDWYLDHEREDTEYIPNGLFDDFVHDHAAEIDIYPPTEVPFDA